METPEKLTANEVRLGNFVYRTIQETETIKLGVKEMEYLYKCVHNGEVANHYPIPFTEEWALKFGFSPSEYQRGIYWNSIDNYIIEIYKESGIFHYNVNGLQIIQLKHVHDIQNLCLSLTKKELKTHEKTRHNNKD